jgi:hypothetical protein
MPRRPCVPGAMRSAPQAAACSTTTSDACRPKHSATTVSATTSATTARAALAQLDDDDAFAFAAGAERPARVGRRELERTLLAAMAQELDAVWWP